jgi:hypothetical protein
MITLYKNQKYKIKTPDGYQFFEGIRRTTKDKVLIVEFTDGTKTECSEEHIFVVGTEQILAKNLKQGTKLSSTKEVGSVKTGGTSKFLYDLVQVGTEHIYITDGFVSHNCDFATSGDTVFYGEYMEFFEQTYIKDPMEKRGADRNLWIWEPVDYSRTYMVVGDVARGDGKDFSAFHILDVENNTQVGEYKGQLPPKEFGHLLVGIATEYNNALLVVENANIGWSTIETILERGYINLYYSPRSGNVSADTYFDQYDPSSNMVPGFTMNLKTRPLVIGKFQEYFNEKTVIIQSRRLVEEMKVFVWKNGRAEAQSGYNDDLVMSFGIGMYIRDTALKYRQQGLDLTRNVLNNITVTKPAHQAVYMPTNFQDPRMISNGKGGMEDISWIYK